MSQDNTNMLPRGQGETLLTIAEAAVLLQNEGWAESLDQIAQVLNTIVAGRGLPEGRFTEEDLRSMLRGGATHATIANPADSPLHRSVQDLGARLWTFSSSTTGDDLTPWKHLTDAASICAPTGDMNRRAMAAALIANAAEREERLLPASTRKSKSKPLGFKYAQANAAARLKLDPPLPSIEDIKIQAECIVLDQGIYLAILDRALAHHPRGAALRAAACLANKLDPLSTADAPQKCKSTRWGYRLTILRGYDDIWTTLGHETAKAQYRADVHEARRLHFAELTRAVQQPDLYKTLFKLRKRDHLRLVGPEILRQRRQVNMALQRPHPTGGTKTCDKSS